MKKILTITSLVVLLMIFSTSMAFAQQEKVNINGEVVEVNGDGSLTVLLKDDSNVIVFPAVGETFDASLISTTIHVRGNYNSDGSIQSEWVKTAGEEDEVDNEDNDKSDPQGKGKGLEKEKTKTKAMLVMGKEIMITCSAGGKLDTAIR
ncbi:MAG: hypothetical protein PVF83_19635 [Anaerolineales bacterium]|jgi:hypothetical protein